MEHNNDGWHKVAGQSRTRIYSNLANIIQIYTSCMDIDIVAAPEVIMLNRSIALTPTASCSLTAAPSAPAPQYSYIFLITATSALWTHLNLRPSMTPTSGNPSTKKGAYTRVNSVKSSARLGS